MLSLDKDIRRLIRIGPVFYPTVFITATALLLKIITISSKCNYRTDEKYLISICEGAYGILQESITSSNLPCYSSVQLLAEGIRKVQQQIGSTNEAEKKSVNTLPRIPAYSQDVTLNGNEIADMMNEFWPVRSSIPLDDSYPVSIAQVSDYSELWQAEIFDANTFVDIFSSEISKSMYQSPIQE
ncbi:hypothetical protein CANTEDRAFT_116912 [Yamadazyma tenuis ATCC 10573]|uniref:Uncharacterized protein n=2 Tax=Candida tenuis TaxID=2315449 RepID=G3BCQ3_CANTC|nr:uncharacterized protein CANTEDRAFT_116912 [Yamadazyma tenuis ATCC 10573]EGV60854.1 hypothetical protein CANTEDRAFT_116912 [Yamadazyma tenuis ATCC 10573]